MMGLPKMWRLGTNPNLDNSTKWDRQMRIPHFGVDHVAENGARTYHVWLTRDGARSFTRSLRGESVFIIKLEIANFKI
jgi:hypothetical protein